MIVTSSIENGWSDLAQIVVKIFEIAGRRLITRLIRKTILGKSTGKVGNLEYNGGATVYYKLYLLLLVNRVNVDLYYSFLSIYI